MHTLSPIELYEEYLELRKIKLSFEQFLAFVTYYPALLVAKTDGEVDEKEWSLLQSLAIQLATDTVSPQADKEELKDYIHLFFDEFQYIMDHLDLWDRKFIKVLRQLVANNTLITETVEAAVASLASASKGVCEKENTMIEYLRIELNLPDLCKNSFGNMSGSSDQANFQKKVRWQEMFTSLWLGF